MKKLFAFLITLITTTAMAQPIWTGTWATAPQWTSENNMPQTALAGNSVRQTVKVSLGGDVIRLQLSNEYTDEATEIKSVFIADAADSCDILPKTARFLTFNGKRNVTMEARKSVMSDPIKYRLRPLQRLSITINYGAKGGRITSHPGSRTTSYIIKGEAKARTSFAKAERTDHWFTISAIDVLSENDGCVAVIGNSITDGRGSTTNLQNRWTDAFAGSLAANGHEIGVLNLGIGANCVLTDGVGEAAVKRFDRDVLQQRNVKCVVIFEGVNDIGGSNGNSETVANALIDAYKDMATKAHAKGMKVICATITPFNGHSYYTHFHEAARQTVNDWIRKSTDFDAIIDFDLLTRDADRPAFLDKSLQEDWLHLNPKGYEKMGKAAASVFEQMK